MSDKESFHLLVGLQPDFDATPLGCMTRVTARDRHPWDA